MNKFSCQEIAMSDAAICRPTVAPVPQTRATFAARVQAELLQLLSQMAVRR
jgi:hypothetical protein